MQIIRKAAYARAGLMGNPSDGFGGRTLSFTFKEFVSNVVLYEWDRIEILWSQQDKGSFATVDELVEDVKLNGYYGGVRLVKGTIKRFVEYCRKKGLPLHDQPFSVRYETNVPRGVGLSGSSAIVVATLRCLLEFYKVEIDPRVQASIARSVENDELGIACGLQDRVAQVYGGLTAMEFGKASLQEIDGYICGTYRSVDTSLLPPLYIAWDEQAAKDSGTVHAPLRQRVQENPKLQDTLNEIADLVPKSIAALESRNYPQFHQCVNRNFDLRTTLYQIADRNREMIEAAREVGASSKFAGSGGAIVGTFPNEGTWARLQQAFNRPDKPWKILRPTIAQRENDR